MNNKKDSSKFVRFCVGTISVLLVGAVCFIFIIFQTDAVFEVALDNNNRYVDFERMSVTTVIEEANNNNSNQPGMGNGAGNGNGGGVMPGSNPGGGGGTVQLGGDAQLVKDKLSNSSYSAKAEALALAYQVCIDNGFSDNAAVGLMACLANEGNLGVVEYSFSSNGAGGFKLPSGGTKAQTKDDIEYLKNWPSDSGDKTTVNGVVKNSCGFGMIQWSFERRVNLCNYYLNSLNSYHTANITDDVAICAETSWMAKELSPGGSYSNAVYNKLNGKDTVEDWCEAFCDAYIKPSKWCGGNMQGTGTCAKYRATATDLASILSS